MIQKLLTIGSSKGITIPKGALQELGLENAKEVFVTVDPVGKRLVVQAVLTKDSQNVYKNNEAELHNLEDEIILLAFKKLNLPIDEADTNLGICSKATAFIEVIDTNIEIAFDCLVRFLFLNGYTLSVARERVTSAILELKAGELPKEIFTEILRDWTVRLT